MSGAATPTAGALVDGLGRTIDYVRLSVTDRCDLRCRYCMAERMEFLPRSDLLTLEELALLGELLIERGVRRIRLTGGEPLVRRNLIELVRQLGRFLGKGLDELTLTTNGTRLAGLAGPLADAGVRRINVSLDSLRPERFAHITRRGELAPVLAGIAAASAAGISLRINMVALKAFNDDEFGEMVRWCGDQGHDLCLIETMPLGRVEERRLDRYLPLDAARESLERSFTLIPSLHRTSGPARYFEVVETGRRIGFITPLTNNFCAACNRVRVTATGTVFACLGHDQKVELRDDLRRGDLAALDRSLAMLLATKPARHDFAIAAAAPAVGRHMSVTGG